MIIVFFLDIPFYRTRPVLLGYLPLCRGGRLRGHTGELHDRRILAIAERADVAQIKLEGAFPRSG